ncbi:MAG: DUF268 domain-containing protein [Acidobacteria bacterium]|nr:DUF268 domain-containing protein [Acidobacteriota bacterium]MBS1865486.1 DUF268 domain-containing protein [Acidobacteriota bacterium]
MPKAPAPIDLSGDRDIEWAFICSRIPAKEGYLLDFGCGHGNLSMQAIQRGYEVLAVDLQAHRFLWDHPKLKIVAGDLLALNLPESSFDVILNCSTVEHVGLSGRYGVDVPETDGDLTAMSLMRRLLKPKGCMLMTIPCGRDAVIVPWHRVYGAKRLPRLLAGFEVLDEQYWVKRSDNRWQPSDKEAALNFFPTGHPAEGTKCSYALGCFVLSPKQTTGSNDS